MKPSLRLLKVSIVLTPRKIADLRSDLMSFVEHMFHERKGLVLKRNWHQNKICEALEKLVIGQVKRLIINIPPRSGKTELAVNHFIAWCMGNWPNSEFIHASYSKRLAATNTYAVRSIMQHEEFQRIFDTTSLMEDSKAKDEFRTRQGGIVYATGSDGTITGYGAGGMGRGFAGAIIIDDPIKPDEAMSDTIRDGVIEWFQNTMESRKNSQDTPIIVIMQRLHERDLSGWLLDGGNGEKWDHLLVPAINENNESFWPEQFPIEDLHRMEEASPYVFAGQYMQSPRPRSGGDFQVSHIQVVESFPPDLKMTRGWDLAGTTKKRSDYTASVKLGICKSGYVWILDVDRFKGAPDDVERAITQKAEIDSRDTFFSLPQDPGQAGVAQVSTLSKRLSGKSFEFTPESGDKQVRASPLAAQINVGNVRMIKAPWNQEFLQELSMFPTGAHDDMVDAASRAYNSAINKRAGFFG